MFEFDEARSRRAAALRIVAAPAARLIEDLLIGTRNTTSTSCTLGPSLCELEWARHLSRLRSLLARIER